MKYSSVQSFLAYRLGVAGLLYFLKGYIIKRSYSFASYSQGAAKQNTVIAVNDSKSQNGGLCDMLHGIVSSYYVAKLSGSEFRIVFSDPFLLTDYLIPNQIDWKFDEAFLDYHTSRVRCVPMMLGRFHSTWAEERAFHLKYMFRQAKHSGVKIFYTNAHLLGENEFSQHFKELFRPSQALQEQIDRHLSCLGREYVGASFRFRNFLGDFKDGDSVPGMPDEQNRLIRKCIDQIELLHRENPTRKIFVTSDSVRFCSALQTLSYVYTIQEQRGHIATHGAASAMSTFVDLMLLSKSLGNRLYITQDMYRSGFSQTASFIGNIPYREIDF